VTTIHLGCSEDALNKVSAASFLQLWKQMMEELVEIGVQGFS
jgi:hypothetical protein